MQVISSRFSLTPRSSSTERTPRRGLSLTSKDKSSSLPKHSNTILSGALTQSYNNFNHKPQLQFNEEIASLQFKQTSSYLGNQTSQKTCQTFSLINSQPSSVICSQFSPYNASQSCTPIEKLINEMPKITFHYSSQPTSNMIYSQKVNHLIAQRVGNNIHFEPNKGVFHPFQQLRTSVVNRSIEAKSVTQKQSVSQKCVQLDKQKKILIDSRIIDRSVIIQEVYQQLPSIKLNSVISSFPLPVQISSISIQSKVHANNSCEKSNQNQLKKQQQSPYCQLLSTTKKYEEATSPFGQKQIQNENCSQTIIFKRVPEIQQFKINDIVVEENQQESFLTSQIHDQSRTEQDSSIHDQSRTEQDSSIHDQSRIEQESIQNNQKQISFQNAKQQLKSSVQKVSQKTQPYLVSSKVQPNQSNEIVQTKQVLIWQYENRCSPEKVIDQKQIQQKVSAKKGVNSILANIQNRPPQNYHSVPISGKRNFKRFREIEKRLEQIISICNSNL